MASTYKTFLNDDVVTARTLLHEAIPITGSIVYGTYGVDPSETHVKKFAHQMFQSVYDYPYLSSSANHIFDIAYGHHSDAYQATTNTSHLYYSKRKNIYNQMAQVLVGHKPDGTIMKFDQDGDLVAGGTKYTSCLFFNFARLLNKDEIKKGSFEMEIGMHKTYGGHSAPDDGQGTTKAQADEMRHADGLVVIKDKNPITAESAATDYRVNSPAGEYGILYINSEAGSSVARSHASMASINPCGLIYYQAGVVVLTTDVFIKGTADAGVPQTPDGYTRVAGRLKADGAANYNRTPVIYKNGAALYSIDEAIHDSAEGPLTNDLLLNQIRKRINKICFNNTTELNSTIYFCRVNHNDFNYSSNPTYLQNSKIRVKSTQSDAPVSYITSVGLYSSDNELLAVAKLSEPLRKDPTNDMTLRVRLDY